jgi:hypothetical protein
MLEKKSLNKQLKHKNHWNLALVGVIVCVSVENFEELNSIFSSDKRKLGKKNYYSISKTMTV